MPPVSGLATVFSVYSVQGVHSVYGASCLQAVPTVHRAYNADGVCTAKSIRIVSSVGDL